MSTARARVPCLGSVLQPTNGRRSIHLRRFSAFPPPPSASLRPHCCRLNSFSFRYFGEDHAGFGYDSSVSLREISVRLKLLAFWRMLGVEFPVNRFPRFWRFWEYYLCFVVRGKVMEFEFEKPS